ncbi:hypothetical protein PGQ11_001910 [Apiospora arundinis]|uniref:Uncharacterized protein n=1 Tax=Apiospora arundinis TaxID=335852 RepID=A0ABR2JGJ9_9PEZI
MGVRTCLSISRDFIPAFEGFLRKPAQHQYLRSLGFENLVAQVLVTISDDSLADVTQPEGEAVVLSFRCLDMMPSPGGPGFTSNPMLWGWKAAEV